MIFMAAFCVLKAAYILFRLFLWLNKRLWLKI